MEEKDKNKQKLSGEQSNWQYKGSLSKWKTKTNYENN